MKTYKTIDVPATTREIIDYVICDLCGDKMVGKEDWRNDRYDALEIEVSMKTGVTCPEGGSGNLIEWDICRKCFGDKITPWFQSQGASGTTTEWDW